MILDCSSFVTINVDRLLHTSDTWPCSFVLRETEMKLTELSSEKINCREKLN